MGSVFKACMSRWASGVAVILVPSEAGLQGITVSAVMSASLEPPLIVCSIDRSASVTPYVTPGVELSLHILSQGQEQDSNFWAGWSQDPGSEVMTDFPIARIDGASASMHLTVDQRISVGDHDLLVMRLLEARVSDDLPLVYHRGQYTTIR